jgi:hypothetical protein
MGFVAAGEREVGGWGSSAKRLDWPTGTIERSVLISRSVEVGVERGEVGIGEKG